MITSVSDLSAFAALQAGFMIAQVDDASNPKYYGFMNRYGEWYILKEDTTAKSYRYCVGASDFDTNWTGRASLTYGYPTVWNV